MVTTAADVQPETVRWLWPGRLPLGKLVVIDGDPSVGKSTLMGAEVASRVSTGARWPDGAPSLGAADVLLLSAEDGIADTIVPRLIAASADLRRVHILAEVPQYVDDESDRIVMVPPSLPRDIPVIENTILQFGVKLMVVDVLMAFLSGKVDAHRDQDVRAVMHQLATVAERTGCCIVLVRHLNKAGGSNALYRGGGSIGIVGAARAAYLVARDPEDTELRVMACTKLNIAVEPPALTYRLIGDDEFGCARVVWEGTSAHTASTLLAGPQNAQERTEIDDAVDWLRSFLTMGSADRKDVLKAAKAESISHGTLMRAQERLGVTSVRSGFPATARWSLPVVAATPRTQSAETTGCAETTGRDQGIHGDHIAPVIQLSQLSHPDGAPTTDDGDGLEILASPGSPTDDREQF